MGASKEMFLIMREQDYNELESEVRSRIIYTEVRESNEYETHKNDTHYLALKKAEKKAKNDLQTYLFNLRHNGKK